MLNYHPTDDEIRTSGRIVLIDDARPGWQVILRDGPKVRSGARPHMEIPIASFTGCVVDAWKERVRQLLPERFFRADDWNLR